MVNHLQTDLGLRHTTKISAQLTENPHEVVYYVYRPDRYFHKNRMKHVNTLWAKGRDS
jgi:hypothetical protein